MTDRQAALAEAIREAIEESSRQCDGSHHVDIPATEAELVAAVKAVWPHDEWDYTSTQLDLVYDGVMPTWDVWGWTQATPENEADWAITVRRDRRQRAD